MKGLSLLTLLCRDSVFHSIKLLRKLLKNCFNGRETAGSKDPEIFGFSAYIQFCQGSDDVQLGK